MDANGDVRAYFNVCRHRGCTLAPTTLSISNKIVCPYHSWQYSLQGALLSARGMPTTFDLDSYHLKSCQVNVFEGLIYINLTSTVDPHFDLAISEALYFLKPLNIYKTKVGASKTWRVKANWKLLVENFEECYHCLSIHPEYSHVMAHAGPESIGSKSLLDKWEANRLLWDKNLENIGHPHGWIPPTNDRLHFCARVPFKENCETQSLDGKLVSTLLGNRSESDGGSTSFRLSPTSFVVACPDHVILICFFPLSAEESIVSAQWLVAEDAREGTDFNPESLTPLWSVTIEQDNWAVELTQPRTKSMAYEAGPFSESEEYSSLFIQWYLSKMQAFYFQ